MSMILLDGFDDNLHDQGRYDTFSMGHSTAYSRSGLTGDYGVQNTGVAAYSSPSSQYDNEATLGVAVYVSSPPNYDYDEYYVWSLRDSNLADIIRLRGKPDKRLVVQNWGNTAYTGGTSTVAVLGESGWHYLELWGKIGNSTGAVKVWWDGSLIIDVSGVDTQNSSTSFGGFRLQSTYSNRGGLYYMDDLYFLNGASTRNNSRLGEIVTKTLFPSGNGAFSGLTGSDGDSVNNYQLVDEQTPSSTDYVGSTSTGTKDTYDFDNLSLTGTIPAAQASMWSAKSDAGGRYGRLVVRNSTGGLSYGADETLTTSYKAFDYIYDVEPVNSTVWTVTNINAIQLGFEVRST